MAAVNLTTRKPVLFNFQQFDHWMFNMFILHVQNELFLKHIVPWNENPIHLYFLTINQRQVRRKALRNFKLRVTDIVELYYATTNVIYLVGGKLKNGYDGKEKYFELFANKYQDNKTHTCQRHLGYLFMTSCTNTFFNVNVISLGVPVNDIWLKLKNVAPLSVYYEKEGFQVMSLKVLCYRAVFDLKMHKKEELMECLPSFIQFDLWYFCAFVDTVEDCKRKLYCWNKVCFDRKKFVPKICSVRFSRLSVIWHVAMGFQYLLNNRSRLIKPGDCNEYYEFHIRHPYRGP